MTRDYIMETERIKFSIWNLDDINLAFELWGEPEVTK